MEEAGGGCKYLMQKKGLDPMLEDEVGRQLM
jgi:hypothetical protein